MYSWLQQLHAKEHHNVIGLMSGTSLDGIDAAWVEISGSGPMLQATLRHFATVPLAPDLRRRLFDLCQSGSAAEACLLNVAVGEAFAEAVRQLMTESGQKVDDFDLIGSHGQTICHLPGQSATWQIGEAAVIAEHTGLPVVSDFRTGDMAAGGQGAPLVPYADWCLLRRPDRTRIVQNIGGIANLTLLPAGGVLDDVRAMDTGPGNMVIDECVRVLTNGRAEFDEDGRVAAQGRVHEAWLEELLRHPFFSLSPPKSAGREEFGRAYAQDFVRQGRERGLDVRGIVATATALTAASIASAYAMLPLGEGSVEVILGGGGAYNPVLRQMLSERLERQSGPGFRVLTHEDVGLRSDVKEALAFAILAHETILGTPNNVPGATGAARPVVLGKITLG